MTLQQAIQDLNATLIGLNQTVANQTPVINSLEKSIYSLRPMFNSIGGVIQRLGNLINPIENFIDAIEQSDKVQKQLLAVNTDLQTFVEQNTKSLEGLRGSFTENVEEFAANFAEGIRINSRSLNVLRDRMQETGQSTSKLREATKTMILATGGNTGAISDLASTNMKIARDSMISNEKLIDAMQRNEDIIDTASLVGLGKEQINKINEVVAALSERGVDEKNQQRIIDLLFSSDDNIVALRNVVGVSTNINEEILTGQVGFREVLSKVAENTEKIFVSNRGTNKIIETSRLLEGVDRSELLGAAVLTNELLKTDAAKKDALLSKEDKYYASMETFIKESKNFANEVTAEHYKKMEKMPEILDVIKNSVLGYIAGKALVEGVDFVRMFQFQRQQAGFFNTANTARAAAGLPQVSPNNPLVVNSLRMEQDEFQRTRGLGSGAGANAARSVKGILDSITRGIARVIPSIGPRIATIIGTAMGPMISGGIGMAFRMLAGLAGPLGILLTLLPTVISWFSSAKEEENPVKKASNDLAKQIDGTSESVKKLGKNIDAQTPGIEEARKYLKDSQSRDRSSTPGSTDLTPKDQQTVGMTPPISPPPQSPAVDTQMVSVKPDPLYLTKLKEVPYEDIQRKIFGEVLPTADDLKKTITTPTGQVVPDLEPRNRLELIKKQLEEERDVMLFAGRVKGDAPGTGRVLPRTNFSTGESLRTEYGWEEKLISGLTRSQVMDRIIKRNEIAEQEMGNLADVFEAKSDILGDPSTKDELLDTIRKYTDSLNQLQSNTPIVGGQTQNIVPPSGVQNAVGQTPTASQIAPSATQSSVAPSIPKPSENLIVLAQIDEMAKSLDAQFKKTKDLVGASNPELFSRLLDEGKVNKFKSAVDAAAKFNQTTDIATLKNSLEGLKRQSEEYNKEISENTEIAAEAQREILSKGIKIREDSSIEQESNKETLSDAITKYLAQAATGMAPAKQDDTATKELTLAIGDLAKTIGKDRDRPGYVGRN